MNVWNDSSITTVYDILSDLSECQLMHVPDAVYHLMRNTELKSCDLSSNVITKITAKFAMKFSLISGKSIIQVFFASKLKFVVFMFG